MTSEHSRQRLSPGHRMSESEQITMDITVTNVLKSLGLAVMGAGVVGFFFTMAVIPILAAMARLSSENPLDATSVVVNPAWLTRHIGLPLAGVAFIVCFVVFFVRFRRNERLGRTAAATR